MCFAIGSARLALSLGISSVLIATALLTACGGGGGEGSSLPQTITVGVTPHARTARVGWIPSAGTPAAFNIYQDGTRVGQVNGTGSDFTLSNLAPSKSYCVEVRSQPVAGNATEDGRSNAACFNTLPTSISGLQLVGKAKDSITLSWSTDPTDSTIIGFRILRSDGVSRTVDATARSVDDGGLTPQSEYCYDVGSINVRGDTSDVVRLCLASGWRNAIVSTVPDGSGTLGASLAIDSAGTPIVAYVVTTPATATSGDLWLARPLGDTWMKQRLVGGVVAHVLAADSSGIVHIAYTDAPTSKLVYARSVDGWTPKIIDDADVSRRPSLVLDAAGNAAVAYVSNGGVKYATNRSGNWATTPVAPGRIGEQNSLTLDALGRAYIALANSGDVQYATQTSTGWSIETAVPFSGGFCSFFPGSTMLATDGSPQMAMTETCHSSGGISYAARLPTGSWQSVALPSPYLLFRAGYAAMATGVDGHTHVAVSTSLIGLDGERTLIPYWTNSSGTWRAYTLTNDPGVLGALRIDVSGERHAVYTSDRDIHYLTTKF